MAESHNDTMAALAGGWAVTEIAFAQLPPEAEVTMFISDGTLSGRAACNFYEAELIVEGSNLSLGPMTQGHEVCETERMEAEVNFLRVLERSTRFEIASDGTLSLFAQDFMMLKARRLEN